ncbi:MAG: hypothetical protein AAF970_04330 [Bacteroidota bacterium]
MRSRAYLLLGVLAAALCVGGCELLGLGGDAGPPRFRYGASFSLALGDTAIAQDGRVQVVFDEVLLDNRCPIGAVCVIAGEARIRVRMQPVPEEIVYTTELRVPPGPYPLEYNDVVSVGRYAIQLQAVYPEPRVEDAPLDASRYRAQMMVRPAQP